jgi:Transposase DDE domain group 1
MAWCEQNRVDFVFGLAPNARLVEEIAVELLQAQAEAFATGKPGRRFKDFRYATLDSWSRRRRVIGKAEWTRGEANPRFIVTSLKLAETNGRTLYEKVYCARGEMENQIKECQGDLFADRTSTAAMHVNPAQAVVRLLRLVLICAVRRVGLVHTQFAEATCGTIRLKLLKLAGLVRVSARRVKFRARLGLALRRRMAPGRRPPRLSRRDADKSRHETLGPQETSNSPTESAHRRRPSRAPAAQSKRVNLRPARYRAPYEKCGLEARSL